MIKFEHSVFALPFALTEHCCGTLHPARLAFLAATAVDCHGHGGGASAAMTINRIADVGYDQENRARRNARSRLARFQQVRLDFHDCAVAVFSWPRGS